MIKLKTTLVILTLNEIEGSKALYDKIPFDAVSETVVVDGGSKDGTVEFWRNKGLRVIGQSKRGRGEAFRMALKETKGDVLILFSPDGNEDPGDIPRFIPYFSQSNNDVVIASRMMKGARNEEDAQLLKIRKWANQTFTLIANIVWNQKLWRGSSNYVSDTINGYRAISRKAFDILKLDEDGFTIEYQMSIRAMKAGMKIKEFPTIEGERIGGESTAKSLPTGIRFLKLIWEELRLGKNFFKHEIEV